MTVKSHCTYTLGLDIGMASVGWSILSDDQIIALGVRAFDKAEEPNGSSLNASRREKRLMRRRIRRRAHRLLRTRRLMRAEGLITSTSPDAFTPSENHQSPWQLRTEGLDRKLTNQEWAAVIHHLIKFRGFHSNRKSELNDDTEVGQMLSGLSENQSLLVEGSYRSPAELAVKHEKFSLNKRNKSGSYTHTFSRKSLGEELATLFDAQRQYGNPHASKSFEEKVFKLFWSQRPPLTGEAMLQLLGRCTFEPNEYRAPKRSYSAERFVWLSKLNNIYLVDDGDRRPLTEAERQLLIPLPFSGKTEKITYKTIRTCLKKNLGFSDFTRFAGLSYRGDVSEKNPEDATIFMSTGWQTIRRVYEKYDLTQSWDELIPDKERMNQLGYVLSVLKTDEEIKSHLNAQGFPEAEITMLLPINFKDFINLSTKAIDKLLPLLEQGKRYDQAATEIYGSHSGSHITEKSRLLPPLNTDEIRNPIVFRAINQSRKVVNALIKEFGPPVRVHIEMARDLTRPFDERRRIEREQHKWRDAKLDDMAYFEAEFGFAPQAKTQDLLKWRLYREQEGKCPYSLKPLAENGDLRTIFDATRTQIDHVLPYSRSFDDGFNNKVLVLSVENQNKGNRTPFEFLDGASESDRWRLFEAWVKSNKKIREAKRQRLLRRQFGEKESSEFKDRNLTDTRYISRFFKNYVEQHLQLAEDSNDQRCVVVSGQLTAFLRARWGLIKARESGDLHHALDATVIAACGHDLVKRLSDYARLGELARVRNNYTDAETGEIIDLAKLRQLESHFPEPFPHFREILLDRLSPQPLYGKPVLVSRAPKRRSGGAAHQETIRSKKRMASAGVSTIKTPLTKLKLSDISMLVGREDPRNYSLYKSIEDRLKTHGDGAKAFGPNLPPLRKQSHKGDGPIVRSVKLEKKKSGLSVRGGIAENDTMIRVDVFRKDARHYLVPIYVADAANCHLPNRAIVPGRPEDQWTLVDGAFEFLFSLHPNDMVIVELKAKPKIQGYFAGCDRSTGAISLWSHDRNHAVGKDGLIRSIGVKTAVAIKKFHVDVLGNLYPAIEEHRHDLAKHRRQ